MDEPYAGICGITKEELLTQMSDDINELAEHLELSREETIQELKDHYDGYHFCWPSPDVFNPYSLLNCFADGEIDSYWFGTGTPTYLINMMRQYDFLPADLGETIEVDKKDFDAPTETMTTIIPLLYQSGYVTIKGYDKPTKLYQLALPNQEIRVGLYGSLLPHYLTDKSAKANTTIAKMSVLVKKGDMDAAFCLLNDFWRRCLTVTILTTRGIGSRRSTSCLPCSPTIASMWNRIRQRVESISRWKRQIPST